MRGKWERGIEPRNFAWVIKDKLAVSERPGGYARNHRKVRRHEEILWLRNQGFTRIVSLLPSSHNLVAYDELGVTWSHFPTPGRGRSSFSTSSRTQTRSPREAAGRLNDCTQTRPIGESRSDLSQWCVCARIRAETVVHAYSTSKQFEKKYKLDWVMIVCSC